MKKKILYFLIFLAIALGLYLISGSKIVTVKQAEKTGGGGNEVAVDVIKMKKDYQDAMQKIIVEYDSLIAELTPVVDNSTSTDIVIPNKEAKLVKVLDLKNRLIDLRLPQKNESHMDFFVSVIKMENFLNSGSITDWRESLEILNKVKGKNDLF